MHPDPLVAHPVRKDEQSESVVMVVAASPQDLSLHAPIVLVFEDQQTLVPLTALNPPH